MKKKQFLAEYFRISLEDEEAAPDDTPAQSASIASQREMIAGYIREKGICPEMQPLEFADDGYSGTNFARPAVQRLLSMAREGEIGCVIVKDISRFGRNYLEVGDYLEQIFPALGVRFIAVSDGYDSADHAGTTGGTETALRSLLYDMYSKDLSGKIRSSLLVRRKRGDYIGPGPPFGYRLQDQKKVLAVDGTAAGYVKMIFRLACDGHGTGRIAQMLNAAGVPTPGQYKNRDRHCRATDQRARWDSAKVRRVLQNKVYLGMAVNGKSRVTEIGGTHFAAAPREEQICVPGKHEAIVTEREFLLASEVIKERGRRQKKARVPQKDGGPPGRAPGGKEPDRAECEKQRCPARERDPEAVRVKKQFLYEQLKAGRLERGAYLKKMEALRADRGTRGPADGC